MSDDPSSLSRLHDISVPPEVSWWPLAPGWLALIAVTAIAISYYFYRSFVRWRRNAYRREAAAALESADSAKQIVEILRRTALAVSSRENVAKLQGSDWPDWLAEQATTNLSPSIRSSISEGLYQPTSSSTDLTELRRFAVAWIRQHRNPC
ncbi:MAG: DUF4381 domain-containing protein [Verrucomicrobiota bacterium]